MVNMHRFASPVWVDDPRRDPQMPSTPSDADFCGWNDWAGAAAIIEAFCSQPCCHSGRSGTLASLAESE
jgi:hypothetical protein